MVASESEAPVWYLGEMEVCSIMKELILYELNWLTKSYEPISGAAVDYIGMDVKVKFGDSRSKFSRYLRGWFRVERTNISKTITFRLKQSNQFSFKDKALQIIRLVNSAQRMWELDANCGSGESKSKPLNRGKQMQQKEDAWHIIQRT